MSVYDISGNEIADLTKINATQNNARKALIVGDDVNITFCDIGIKPELGENVEYTKVQNEYPDTHGEFQPYNNWWRSDYIPITEAGFFYKINRPNISSLYTSDQAIYDSEKVFISNLTLSNNLSEYTYCEVPENAAYLIVSSASDATIDIKLSTGYYFDGCNRNTGDIIKDNPDVLTNIVYAKQRIYDEPTIPLCLVHLSDIHGHTDELGRAIQFAKHLDTEIDDIIHTGDMVAAQYSDGMSFWDSVDGTEEILTCIGNHDVTSSYPYNSYGNNITMLMAYNRYFAPYIDNWGCTYSEGKTYYYKDYAEKKVRLISLDFCLSGDDKTAQNTWLESALSGAKSLGYTVVIMIHTPVHHAENLSCGFNMVYNHWDYEFEDVVQNIDQYQATVQTFINGGGLFACYLCGHTHYDKVSYNTNYPNQLCIAVTCTHASSYYNDQPRKANTSTMDAFNIVLVDVEHKIIKLIRVGANKDNYLRPRNVMTIAYETKQIIADY